MSDSELGTRPAMGCSPGTVLGSRYTLRRRIGSGGYSEVWAGHDAVLDRPVAVKLLHAEHTGHAETLHRFRSEAQLSAQLSDANIARVYDFNDAGGEGTPYLVMEFVDGPTLAQILRAGPLPAARAMDILAQAAAGLQAAHSAGLVHRDIKPSQHHGRPPGNVVKITDFGLSHTLASAPITRTDMVAGHSRLPGPRAVSRRPGHGGQRPVWPRRGRLRVRRGRAALRGHADRGHAGAPRLPVPAGAAGHAGARGGPDRRAHREGPGQPAASAGAVARAAAGLRDALLANGGALEAGTPALTRPAGPDPRTLIAPGPSAGPDSWSSQPATGPIRRGPTAAVGWVLAATLGVAAVIAIAIAALAHKPATPAGASPPSSRPPSASPQAVRAVDVSRSSLIGEPVLQAYRQLRGEGFRVRIQWQRTDQQQPGTVLNVRPARLRPPGSLITLVAALRDHGNGHGKGNGHGGAGTAAATTDVARARSPAGQRRERT